MNRMTSALTALLLSLFCSFPGAAGAGPVSEPPRCGQPQSIDEGPKSSDALAVLRKAVGTSSACDVDECICDVTGDGEVLSSDALRVLRAAVGQAVTLNCLCSDLYISEIVNSGAEFVEIFYGGPSPRMPLDDVYLSDRHDYFLLSNATNDLANSTDFLVQFPPDSTIADGEHQTVAISTITSFTLAYLGVCPTYTVQEATAPEQLLCPGTRTMLVGGRRFASSTSSLTNAGEPVVVFEWNGVRDLVLDLDYVYYGQEAENEVNPGIDKSGIAVDGPDAGDSTSTYESETPLAQQSPALNHTSNGAIFRCDFDHSTEEKGGNGFDGFDVTSEDWLTSFVVSLGSGEDSGATPNTGTSGLGCF